MKTSELIKHAQEIQSEPKPETLLEALEVFYMHGFPDEQSGDVETFFHFYRVDRWLVVTDSQGFKYVSEYESECWARQEFEDLETEYAAIADREND